MIRFGYACQLIDENNKTLSCLHRMTYKKYKILNEQDALDKLIKIGIKNLKKYYNI